MSDVILQLGRHWCHEWDCYEAIRDFYRSNFQLELRDYARPEDWWVKAPELDLLRNNFRNEGFEVMPNIANRDCRTGDLILIASATRIISHCAVYITNNWMYHAPFRETARKDLWAGYWKDKTMAVARHPACKRPDTATQVALIDLLPPEKQRRYRELLSAHRVPTGGT